MSEKTESLPTSLAGVELRETVMTGDGERVRRLVAATAFFHPAEEEIAEELVVETVSRGEEASGYRFLLAERDGDLVGYSCYGPIPLTVASWDLYWIAVHPELQGQRLGRFLLHESERRIRASGGARVYVDTSSRAQYQPTRAFYERCGYFQAACFDDFYAPGDGKVVYCKVL